MNEHRPPPVFVADAPGLDFLNSISTPIDEEMEWIGTGEDFAAWLVAAGLVPVETIDALRTTALPGEFDTVASQARKLREWFRAFVRAHKGKPLKPRVLQELEPLNIILARDEEFSQVVARATSRSARDRQEMIGDAAPPGLAWSLQRRWRTPEALLTPVAKAMAELVCDDDFTQVKACEGHNCSILFVDRTRGHARRWCSMAVCGNRAKQTAHRLRALAARR